MFASIDNFFGSVLIWNFNTSFLKSCVLKNDEIFKTQMFCAKNYDKLWFSLSLNPNKNGAVWIYFNCFSGNDQVKVNLKYRTDTLFNSKTDEFIFETSESKGFKLLEHKKLMEIKSEIYVINFHVSFTVQPFTYKNCFLSKKLFISDKKDMKIVIGDQQIMVHKIFLETFSPIFKKMIEAQNTDNKNVIEITDCDYQLFENVIKFCYGISEILPTKIEDLIFMLEFSNKYEINDLKKEIEFKLMPQISEKNISKFTNAAIKNNAEMLKAVCQSKLTKFIKNCNATVIKEIDNLDCEFVKKVYRNLAINQGIIDPFKPTAEAFLGLYIASLSFSFLIFYFFFANRKKF